MTRLIAVAAVALVAAAPAAAPIRVTLPARAAQLTAAPPLEGGATSASEIRKRHRVDSTTRVTASVDASGTPFRLVAEQRLVVRGAGDYVFSIRARAVTVSAAPGSASTPGL